MGRWLQIVSRGKLWWSKKRRMQGHVWRKWKPFNLWCGWHARQVVCCAQSLEINPNHFSALRLQTTTTDHEVDRYFCEFVGQPLLKGRDFTYSTHRFAWESKKADVTSSQWGWNQPEIYNNFGWHSFTGDVDPWMAFYLDKPYVVKLAVVMPLLRCCQNNKGLTVRVGYTAGTKQPVCGHLDNYMTDKKPFYIPCTRLIKGDTITFQGHKKDEKGAAIARVEVFGFSG